MQVEKYAHGAFCWTDLATPNADQAKSFYNTLFGWEAADVPAGPGMIYSMLSLNGTHVGALYQATDQPPHWSAYINVTDVDEIAAKAVELGGTVIMGPHDVMDAGRMVFIQDPTGAIAAYWQAKGHCGAGVVDEPGAFCWFELATRDTAGALSYYTSLLGWTVRGTLESQGYEEWLLDGTAIGGMMPMGDEFGEMPPCWGVYFQVADCDATVELAKANGAAVYVEPKDIPGTGRFSVLADPGGAAFNIIQLASH